jgi:hypothetical protein
LANREALQHQGKYFRNHRKRSPAEQQVCSGFW